MKRTYRRPMRIVESKRPIRTNRRLHEKFSDNYDESMKNLGDEVDEVEYTINTLQDRYHDITSAIDELKDLIRYAIAYFDKYEDINDCDVNYDTIDDALTDFCLAELDLEDTLDEEVGNHLQRLIDIYNEYKNDNTYDESFDYTNFVKGQFPIGCRVYVDCVMGMCGNKQGAGTVKKINSKGVTVEFDDGTTKTIPCPHENCDIERI